jgi:hypothetical protein
MASANEACDAGDSGRCVWLFPADDAYNEMLRILRQKWIVQMRCHTTEFVWANALSNKSSAMIAKFGRQVFETFGPPKILQCDNGAEFKGAFAAMLAPDYPSVLLIHGRPRHPQTQGAIER